MTFGKSTPVMLFNDRYIDISSENKNENDSKSNLMDGIDDIDKVSIYDYGCCRSVSLDRYCCECFNKCEWFKELIYAILTILFGIVWLLFGKCFNSTYVDEYREYSSEISKIIEEWTKNIKNLAQQNNRQERIGEKPRENTEDKKAEEKPRENTEDKKAEEKPRENTEDKKAEEKPQEKENKVSICDRIIKCFYECLYSPSCSYVRQSSEKSHLAANTSPIIDPPKLNDDSANINPKEIKQNALIVILNEATFTFVEVCKRHSYSYYKMKNDICAIKSSLIKAKLRSSMYKILKLSGSAKDAAESFIEEINRLDIHLDGKTKIRVHRSNIYSINCEYLKRLISNYSDEKNPLVQDDVKRLEEYKSVKLKLERLLPIIERMKTYSDDYDISHIVHEVFDKNLLEYERGETYSKLLAYINENERTIIDELMDETRLKSKIIANRYKCRAISNFLIMMSPVLAQLGFAASLIYVLRN